MEYSRVLDLGKLLKKNSFFLFGPRATGKSFLIKHALKPQKYYDLLSNNLYTELLIRPERFYEELSNLKKGSLVVVDEIQKLPKLLDEIHRLIEDKQIRFLVTGSSARKLKRGAANLLAGRAWKTELFPLVSKEITSFDLLKYLNYGGLPRVYLSKNPHEELNAYITTYLKEEILDEAISRKLDHFSRVLEITGVLNGEELSYEGISRDTGVNVKTVANYIEVLEDTLLAYQVIPFSKSRKRKAIARSKLYLFDIGVANYLARRGKIEAKSELFGKVFEHFIANELRAYLSYRRKDLLLQYWRSTTGFEVDFVIGTDLAIEVKGSSQIVEKHLKGLKALKEEKLIKQFLVVSTDTRERTIDGIRIVPWKQFLTELWDDKLL